MSALPEGMTRHDLTPELWREYDFGGRVYRIEDANGVVHCVPAPGADGCALRWKQREGVVSF